MTATDHGTWTRSFGNLAVGEFFTSALRLLALLIVARRLGPDAFGTVTVGIIVGGYLVMLAHPGLEIAGTRKIAVDPDGARVLLARVVGLRLLLSAAAYPVAVLATVVLPIDRDTSIVIVIFGLLIFTQALDVRWAFVGIQRTATVAAASVIGAIVYLLAVVLLVQNSADLFIVAVAHVSAQALIALLLILASRRRFGRWAPNLHRRIGRKTMLIESTPLTAAYMARAATVSIDVVFVKMFRPADEAGYYAAASRIMTVGLVYLGLYYGAMLPSLVRASQHHSDLIRLIRAGARRALLFGGLIATTAIVLTPLVLPVVFGEEYQESVVLLQILIAALFVVGFSGLVNQSLIALNRRRTFGQVMVIGLVVNVCANIVLIPTVGVVGAALATLIGEVAVLLVGAVALSSALSSSEMGVAKVTQ